MIDSKKILLVEDDPSLGFVIKDNLSLRGYDVTLCKDGEAGERLFHAAHFDLCIFDIMLPKKDGFALAQAVRNKNSSVPILFLTAKSMMEDKLEGYRAGADDYITKPFSLEELLCKIEVFLRRSLIVSVGENDEERIVSLGKYQFDFLNLTWANNGTEKTLTQ